MTAGSRTQICRQCDERHDAPSCFLATRKGGGNWRRSARNYRSRICYDCARKLVATATPGHTLNDRWDVRELARAIELKDAKP